MFYKLAYAYVTRQACRQWGQRNRGDQEFMVLQCDDPKCAPKLD